MKKYLKIILLIGLTAFCLFTTKVLAINMNSIEDNTTRRNTANATLDDEYFEEDTDLYFSPTANQHAQVTSTQNEKASLSFEGYASVILIAIGIVLIFLAIAILIRCK